MKCLVIIAAVVLICQSAKVPQEVTHQVMVALPNSVLAPPSSSKDSTKPEIPAQVIEVAKDHKQITEGDKNVLLAEAKAEMPVVIPTVVEKKRETTAQPEVKNEKPTVPISTVDKKNVVMTTLQPETKTVMTSMTEMRRKTHAVIPTVQPEVKTVKPAVEVSQVDVENVVMATVQPESKTVMPTVTETMSKTRAVMTTVQPEVKNEKTTVKPSVQVPQEDVKDVVMSTMQPKNKSIMNSMTEMMDKNRAVMTPVQPEVKTVKPAVQVPQVDVKNVVMATVQPEIKTVMPTVVETVRKTRAVMTTVQPEVKNEKTTVKPSVQVPQEDVKNVVMSTMQPKNKSIMNSITEMMDKNRAVMTPVQPEVKTVKPAVQVPQIDVKNVVMATVQPEIKTVMPTVVETMRKTRAVMTTVQPEVKAVKPSVQVPQVDVKNIVMTTVKPETKTVITTMTEMKRKTRAVMTTVKLTDQVPKMETKNVVMTTMQPETKNVMSTVMEMKRETPAVMTTVQPEVKTVKPTDQVDTKTVAMTMTMQPETKTLMPTMSEKKRKTRAVTFWDNEAKKVNSPRNNDWNMLKRNWSPKERSVTNKWHSHRSIRSVTDETTTKIPVTSVQPVSVKEIVGAVKTSEPATTSTATKSTIDPCELLCTKFEFEPICATNGLCLHEFPNQCLLDTFNCKHPRGKFAATKDDSCQMTWLDRCEESDMQ